MKKIVSLLLGASLSMAAAFALEACGGNAIGVSDFGDQTPACRAGEVVSSPTCTGACPAGQVAGFRCFDNGSGFSGCGCFVPNGSTVDAGVAMSQCTNGTVTLGSACRTDCGSAQTTSMTCVGGAWTDCRCTATSPGGTPCVANSITENNCGGAVCPAGQYAGQQCNSAGNGYGTCQCFVRSGAPTVCNAGYQRNCGTPIECGTGRVPREVCTGGTAWSSCQCVDGLGGSTQICVPNQATSGACTCTGGVGGVQYCNGAGTGYTCSCSMGTACTPGQLYVTSACTGRLSCPSGQTSQQQCTTAGMYGDCQCASGAGSSGGAQTMRIEIDPAFWEWDRNTDGSIMVNSSGQQVRFCDQSGLNVRCFIAGGEQVREPRTTDRTLSLRDWKAGYVNCDVTCGTSADAPVHPLLWRGNWNNLTVTSGRGVRTLSVTGGGSTASMANQVGTALYCRSPGGTKIRAAIDADQLGICT